MSFSHFFAEPKTDRWAYHHRHRSLGTTDIAELSTSQAAALTASQVNALGTTDLQYLATTQIAALSTPSSAIC